MTAKDDTADDRRIQAIAADQPPFAKLMGIKLIEVSRDRVVAEIVVREELTNRNGGLHGGAVMGIADNMGGTATFLNMPPGSGTTTIETGATLQVGSFIGGSLSLNGGTLSGTGTLGGDVNNAAGTVRPGSGLSGQDAGELAGVGPLGAPVFEDVTAAFANGTTLSVTLADGSTQAYTLAAPLPGGDSVGVQLDGQGDSFVVISNSQISGPATYTWQAGVVGNWFRARP